MNGTVIESSDDLDPVKTPRRDSNISNGKDSIQVAHNSAGQTSTSASSSDIGYGQQRRSAADICGTPSTIESPSGANPNAIIRPGSMYGDAPGPDGNLNYGLIVNARYANGAVTSANHGCKSENEEDFKIRNPGLLHAGDAVLEAEGNRVKSLEWFLKEKGWSRRTKPADNGDHKVWLVVQRAC